MTENILLKKNPKIEFQLSASGFNIIDERTSKNSGFYPYSDLQSIELNKAWFPRLAGFLRIITWFANGVPYFPNAESYKKAKLIFHFKTSKLNIWLTDTFMAKQAKNLERILEQKLSASIE